MNKFLATIFALCFICSGTLSQQTYNNYKYHFRLNLPDEWKINDSDTNGVVLMMAAAGNNAELNVSINEQEDFGNKSLAEVDLEDFISPIEEQFKSQYKDYRTVSYGKMVIDNLKSFYIIYVIVENDIRFKGSEYFFIKKGRLYTITAGCPENEYVNYGPVFKDCVNSFRFEK